MGQTSTYAIDFGTSNTVIARWNGATQAAETLPMPDLSLRLVNNPPLIPSQIYVKDAAAAELLVGQQVSDRGLNLASDPRFFRNFKRGIGVPIQGFLPELDGVSVTFEQVGQWFLAHLIQTLQKSDSALNSLIFTVPVDSFEAYRHWLGQACQAFPVEQVRMLDEPTAAALGYGLADQETLLVVDFGGGTLDLSLVQLEVSRQSAAKPLGFILRWANQPMAEDSAQQQQTARVLAKAGQNLGGADIDNWLVDYFATTQGMAVSPLTLRLAERLKVQLSSQTAASEVHFNDETLETLELELDRDRFNAILTEHQFFQQLDESMTQVLRQARRQGIEPEDVGAVLMVGGTCQIPAVQDWINNYFPAHKVHRDRPFEAIAHGALQLSQGMDLKDFLYHGYGIRYWNRRQNRHDWHPIISKGQPYPMEQPIELVLGASVDNQPSIELVVGELGAETTRTEVYFDGDRLMTRNISEGPSQVQPLNDREGARSLARLNPPGYPGSDRIKLQFWVDRDRTLRVTVEDLLSNTVLLQSQALVQLS